MGLLVSFSSLYAIEREVGNTNLLLGVETDVMKDTLCQRNCAQEGSMWDHLRANFKLQHFHQHAGVIAQRQRYLSSSYSLRAVLKRATPYLHFITQELEKRNLPAELALLPLIESAFDPMARSHKNAAGLWQLIPNTARLLGVEQNRWYDGRHDIYASTKAALNHLAYLNKLFKGDWLITLAAYNAGEGAIGRVIQHNRAAGKPIDYWSLRIPTAETRAYVLRFLALIDIIENAKKYNFALPEIPNQPAVMLVEMQQQTDLNRAAQMAGISLKELYAYNPGIKRNVQTTPPNGPHHLLLPVDQTTANTLTAFIGPPEKSEDEPITYQAKRDDTLITIASVLSTSVKELLHWNT